MAGQSSFVLSTGALKIDSVVQLDPHIAALRAPGASTTIKQVDFSGNTLGVPACQDLATHLRELHALEHANFADIFTGRLLSEIPPALDAILEALLTLPNLHTINLSDNAFGLNTQGPLIKYLERAVPLRHLILNNNGLGPEAGTNIANAIYKLASAKTAVDKSSRPGFLETIVCGRNRLESGSMEAWGKAVAAHGDGLKEVRMVQNGIRPEGIQILLRSGLVNCNKLKVVDLQDNTFTRTAGRALADVVRAWPELVELGIGDCLVGPNSMVALADTFSKGQNKSVEVLRLQFNDIDIRGVRSLVDACDKGSLPALRRVELNGNLFEEDDPAVEALKELLQERKEKSDRPDVDDEDAWGLDELDELDEPGDEEDEEDEDGDDDDSAEDGPAAQAREVKQTEQAEQDNVAVEKDADVDALADKLNKTL